MSPTQQHRERPIDQFVSGSPRFSNEDRIARLDALIQHLASEDAALVGEAREALVDGAEAARELKTTTEGRERWRRKAESPKDRTEREKTVTNDVTRLVGSLDWALRWIDECGEVPLKGEEPEAHAAFVVARKLIGDEHA